MTNKSYKAIFVTPELHHQLKKLALENKITMIQMLVHLIGEWEKQFVLPPVKTKKKSNPPLNIMT